MKGYINTLNKLNIDLKKIFGNDALDLHEKQKLLEKLFEMNQSFEMELKYNVPKSLSHLINKSDEVLFDSYCLERT